MSHKIQITVDEELNETIKVGAEKMGLSVSSYARLVLMSILPQKGNKLLNQALKDIQSDKVETLTLDEFNHQLKKLYAAARTN